MKTLIALAVFAQFALGQLPQKFITDTSTSYTGFGPPTMIAPVNKDTGVKVPYTFIWSKVWGTKNLGVWPIISYDIVFQGYYWTYKQVYINGTWQTSTLHDTLPYYEYDSCIVDTFIVPQYQGFNFVLQWKVRARMIDTLLQYGTEYIYTTLTKWPTTDSGKGVPIIWTFKTQETPPPTKVITKIPMLQKQVIKDAAFYDILGRKLSGITYQKYLVTKGQIILNLKENP
jgi:hypothetical protein